MHNIRKIVIRLALILVVVIVYENIVDYAYRPYKDSVTYTMQDRKKLEGTLETVFCGTSSVQRGISPEMMNEELDTVSFNLATSLQLMDGTYHLLRSVVEENPVETVFLGVAPDLMMREDEPTDSKVLVYERMTDWKDKVSYLIDGCSIQEWPYIMLYSTRVEDYFDFDYVQENIEFKRSKEYKTRKTGKIRYRNNGMYSLKKSTNEKQVTFLEKKESTFQADLLNKKKETYYRKTIEYCKENNIEVVLVYVPISGNAVENLGDITPVHEYYAELAKEYDIAFFDFNYYKELVTTFDNQKFESGKHLNYKGAKEFTKLLAEVYKAYHREEDMSTYFMDTCPYYVAE